MVKACLEQGLTPGYTLDVFAINLASQFVLSFTRYGWYLYMLIPAYAGWKLLGFLWAYLAATQVKEPEQPVDPKDAKKQAKAERKEARGKVKYVR